MVRVPPPARRSTSRQTPDGLEIRVPSKRNVFVMLFLLAWLVAWGFGEVMVSRELLLGDPGASALFLVVWLIMWTLGGGLAIYAWLRMLAGSERVVLGRGVLAIRTELFGVGPAREYDLMHVKNLRIERLSAWPTDMGATLRFWGIGGGPIAFDYGSKTVRFGAGLDDAEARDIIAELRERHSFPELQSR